MRKTILFILSILLVPGIYAHLTATPYESYGYMVSPYQDDLNEWTDCWKAPQAIYEGDIYQDNPNFWYSGSSSEGSTWNNNASGYGILIIDILQLREMNRFRVFQMFSDGKTTPIEISKNTDYLSNHQPSSSDEGWVSVTNGLITIGAGTNNTSYISNPTDISVYNFSSRYTTPQVPIW